MPHPLPVLNRQAPSGIRGSRSGEPADRGRQLHTIQGTCSSSTRAAPRDGAPLILLQLSRLANIHVRHTRGR